MQPAVLALASTLGAVCATGTLALILYAFCYNRTKKGESGRRDKVYTFVHTHSCDGDSVNSEKMHILQPSPSLDTVPFQVPGSVSARGWGPDTPKSSVSDLDLVDRTDLEEEEHPRVVRVIRAREASSLGFIDPALYQLVDDQDEYELPDNHLGRIWFAVAYERESEKLLVSLIKAKNLPSRSYGSTNACDPLVRMYLLPDERRYMQSKCKKKTCNPKYQEDFILQVPQRTFHTRVLKLTVYDVDRHKRHRVIGHATYSLQDHNEDSGEKAVIWRDLERDIPETSLDRGDVMVSLCYNDHCERLTVGVYEGRGFKKVDERNQPDFYLRVSLLLQSRVTKTKKTSTIRQTSDPVFNESFNLKLALTHLDAASVSINAMQVISGGRDKCTGRIVIGSFMFARGKELDHWNEMTANQRQQTSHWHALT